MQAVTRRRRQKSEDTGPRRPSSSWPWRGTSSAWATSGGFRTSATRMEEVSYAQATPTVTERCAQSAPLFIFHIFVCFCTVHSGAFLVPYVAFAVTCGLPLFLLETSTGQYTQEGGITCWRRLCPLAQGKPSLNNH